MKGAFEDFLGALLAFESGWDRERYNSGIIQDWQLDTWAGGSVETFFPDYSSWSDLTDAEWETMAYRSTNSYGFVGYQFGEALLIDLGYYDDDSYYGNGASTNTWDGTWTGKNGVNSLEDFMTKEAQDVAIREAFGYNLGIIENALAAAGKSLDDYIGTTINSVSVTLTGILASAHLRGAWGTASLLLNGTVSTDEYGTSILKYMEQFGNYEAPGFEDVIAYFEDRLTGDEGLGTPGDEGSAGTDTGATDDGNSDGSGDMSAPEDNGSADVTADTADVVINWAWGSHDVVTDFDPATDTIYVGWLTSEHIEVYEDNGSVVFSMPSNEQTTMLQGVSLSDLSAANFTIEDTSAAQEILALVGQNAGSTDDTGDATDTGNSGDTGDSGDTGNGGDTDSGDTSSGSGDGDGTPDVVHMTWNWGAKEVISGFNPSEDVLDFGALSPAGVEVSEADGDLYIEVLDNGGHTYVIENIQAEDLSLENLAAANWNDAVLHDQDGVIEQLSLLGNDDIA